MFIGTMITTAMGVIEEHNAFLEYVATLPESERDKAIAKRKERLALERQERERREYLEAIKPHNFWSFFGLGSK